MAHSETPRADESRDAEQGPAAGDGGLGTRLDDVDLEQSQRVGADPPGGLGTDIGGGSGPLGQDHADDEEQAA